MDAECIGISGAAAVRGHGIFARPHRSGLICSRHRRPAQTWRPPVDSSELSTDTPSTSWPSLTHGTPRAANACASRARPADRRGSTAVSRAPLVPGADVRLPMCICPASQTHVCRPRSRQGPRVWSAKTEKFNYGPRSPRPRRSLLHLARTSVCQGVLHTVQRQPQAYIHTLYMPQRPYPRRPSSAGPLLAIAPGHASPVPRWWRSSGPARLVNRQLPLSATIPEAA